MEVAPASEAALRFLLRARNWQGWWQDFRLAPGFSDEWVTAYVGTVLAAFPDARATEAATAAWNLLTRRQRSSGAWAYNALPPGDADSTGWAVQLADAVGEGQSERAQLARRYLAQHVRPDGGIATYASDGPIRRFINLPPDRSLRGWCGTQPCVTAAIALLPDFYPQVRPYLRVVQGDNGSWQSYWWCEDEYATCLAAEVLARGGEPEDAPRVERAVRWACERVNHAGFVATDKHPEGSPFATALCLRTLLLAHDPDTIGEPVQAVTAWLVDQQRPAGSWISSARLRVPQPDDKHPDTYQGWVYGGRIQGSIVFDQRGIFTTATVLKALQTVNSSVSMLPSASPERTSTPGARQ